MFQCINDGATLMLLRARRKKIFFIQTNLVREMKFLLNFANALFLKPKILNGCERRNFGK